MVDAKSEAAAIAGNAASTDRRHILRGAVVLGAFAPVVRAATPSAALSGSPMSKAITIAPSKPGLVAMSDVVLRIHSPIPAACGPLPAADAPGYLVTNVVGSALSPCGPGTTNVGIAASLAAGLTATLPAGWTATSAGGVVTVTAPACVPFVCSLEAPTTGEFGNGGCALQLPPAVNNVGDGAAGNQRAAWVAGYSFS